MKRIDGAGATESNRFSEGNPETGLPATVVTAAWANSVQEEIARAIELLGGVLDAEVEEQLGRLLRQRTISRVNGVPVITVTTE